MGMGEPFLNYDNVMKAIKYLNEDLDIGARRMSISTSGVLHGIKKFSNEKNMLDAEIRKIKIGPYRLKEVFNKCSCSSLKTKPKINIGKRGIKIFFKKILANQFK